MNQKSHVLVAMSGGVDSSVAAGLLLRQGYEVTGVFMCLGQAKDTNSDAKGCCSPHDAKDAAKVASILGIRFCALDFSKELEPIIDYFVEEYSRGRTPNPCIICNNQLKFGKLIEHADQIGAGYVATGHYGRIDTVAGQNRLCRALDADKDQSYALFGIGRDKLAKVLLPVGQYTKSQIRQLARDMKLPVHDKGESQEICFVPDDDYAGFVERCRPQLRQPGPVVDQSGKLLGQHDGVFHYTIGQRRGLGIAMGQPAYVIRLDAPGNTVVLGSRNDLMQKYLTTDNTCWLIDPAPREPFRAVVQIRYNHRGAPALVTPLADELGQITRVKVDFDQPVSAVTPGQAAVFYDDQLVVGGGWIY